MAKVTLNHGVAIEQFFATKDYEAYRKYLQSLDYLGKIEAAKELNIVMKEIAAQTGANINPNLFKEFDATTELHEKTYLDKQLLSLELETGINVDNRIQAMYGQIEEYRKQLKNTLDNNNESLTPLTIKVTLAIIEYEKKNGLYNKEKWMGIEEKLSSFL